LKGIAANDVNEPRSATFPHSTARNSCFAEAAGALHDLSTVRVCSYHSDNPIAFRLAEDGFGCFEISRRLDDGLHV